MGLTIVLRKVFDEQLLDGHVVECTVECPVCGGEGGEWGPSSLFAGYDECWHRCPRCDGDGLVTVSPLEAQQIAQLNADAQLRERVEEYLRKRYHKPLDFTSFAGIDIRDYWSR